MIRFACRADAAATLAIRNGDPAGIDFYIDEHRVHVADDTTADLAYSGWRADRDAGRDAILIAPPTTRSTRSTNARLDRLTSAPNAATTEVTLSDGLKASAGDIVCTRRNARWLRIGVTLGYAGTIDAA